MNTLTQGIYGLRQQLNCDFGGHPGTSDAVLRNLWWCKPLSTQLVLASLLWPVCKWLLSSFLCQQPWFAVPDRGNGSCSKSRGSLPCTSTESCRGTGWESPALKGPTGWWRSPRPDNSPTPKLQAARAGGQACPGTAGVSCQVARLRWGRCRRLRASAAGQGPAGLLPSPLLPSPPLLSSTPPPALLPPAGSGATRLFLASPQP